MVHNDGGESSSHCRDTCVRLQLYESGRKQDGENKTIVMFQDNLIIGQFFAEFHPKNCMPPRTTGQLDFQGSVE